MRTQNALSLILFFFFFNLKKSNVPSTTCWHASSYSPSSRCCCPCASALASWTMATGVSISICKPASIQCKDMSLHQSTQSSPHPTTHLYYWTASCPPPPPPSIPGRDGTAGSWKGQRPPTPRPRHDHRSILCMYMVEDACGVGRGEIHTYALFNTHAPPISSALLHPSHSAGRTPSPFPHAHTAGASYAYRVHPAIGGCARANGAAL